MDDVRNFLEEIKLLLPGGDMPEYVFKMVELMSEAEKAIEEAYERCSLADATVVETKETIARLEDENKRLRDINIKALLNQPDAIVSEKKEEKEDDEPEIKTVEQILEEGVD